MVYILLLPAPLPRVKHGNLGLQAASAELSAAPKAMTQLMGVLVGHSNLVAGQGGWTCLPISLG